MTPNCRTLGTAGHFNHALNFEAWERAFEEYRPHIQFCGAVADAQLNCRRHFFVEQPIDWKFFSLKQKWEFLNNYANTFGFDELSKSEWTKKKQNERKEWVNQMSEIVQNSFS